MSVTLDDYEIEKLAVLGKRHRELEEELKACRQAMESAKNKVQKIKEKEDPAERLIDYQKFIQGDKTIYTYYLVRRLKELQQTEKHGDVYSIRRGRKFDTIMCSNIDIIKVNKRNGDVHLLISRRKPPQQHLIHPTLHRS